MAFDRHTIFGGALVGVIVAACIAGVAITGGPGEARREKEDSLRLQAVAGAALALACYQQEMGNIPEDLSIVEEELSHAASETHRKNRCGRAKLSPDPVSGEHFTLKRDAGQVTHICADFKTRSEGGRRVYYSQYGFYAGSIDVIPGLEDTRETAGEYCFELNLDADLD